MEKVSYLLVLTATVIIIVVLLIFVRLKRIAEAALDDRQRHRLTDDLDPLFAHRKAPVTPVQDGAENPSVLEPALPPLHQPSLRAISETVPARSVRVPAFVARRDTPFPAAESSSKVEPLPRQPDKALRTAPRLVEEGSAGVVTLNVVAREDRFCGTEVYASLQQRGLEYGAWQIFHYYGPDQAFDAPPHFSVANLIKPGTFNLEQMESFSTVGLSFFMVPTGEPTDLGAFDAMFNMARGLATELGGEVRDARRSVLTRQAIEQLRAQITDRSLKNVKVLHS